MKRIIFLGLIISIGAFIETARVYGTSGFISQQMVEASTYDKNLNLKIATSAKDSQCSPDFIQLVSNRMMAIDEAQTTKIAMANNVTNNALIQGVLWLFVILVFVIMLLKNNSEKNKIEST